MLVVFDIKKRPRRAVGGNKCLINLAAPMKRIEELVDLAAAKGQVEELVDGLRVAVFFSDSYGVPLEELFRRDNFPALAATLENIRGQHRTEVATRRPLNTLALYDKSQIVPAGITESPDFLFPDIVVRLIRR